jgi:hypothetical protein
MFHPTHWLVSRHRKTPVQLVPSASGFHLMTVQEAESSKTAAFELRARLGIFCQGIQIVGHRLEPMAIATPIPLPNNVASNPASA